MKSNSIKFSPYKLVALLAGLLVIASYVFGDRLLALETSLFGTQDFFLRARGVLSVVFVIFCSRCYFGKNPDVKSVERLAGWALVGFFVIWIIVFYSIS